MLENDEPWKLPEPQRLTQAPKLLPQVPELTIISTENKPSTKNNNFLHRAILTEKNLKPQISTANIKSPIENRGTFQPLISNQKRFSGESSYQKSPTNILKDDNRAFTSTISKPSVPDVTILDDENNQNKNKSTERVFTSSYKEMLINSHDQFMNQFNRETASNKNVNQVPLSRFKQNPLSRYNPSPEAKTFKDGNSSSILSDIDITQNNNNNKNNEGGSDEVTFKKVAEMLSEIQKLVITEKSPQTKSPSSSNGESDQPKSSNIDILRQLAKTYLSSDELLKYHIDSELSELEKCQL